MRIHRRTLLGGLSAGAVLGLGKPAFASLSVVTAADDQLTIKLEGFPERVMPGGLLDAYARNRQTGTANLITESFLVHTLSLTRRRAQQAQETTVLEPALAAWIKALQTAAAAAPDLPDLARDLIAVLAALQSGRDAAAGRARALAEYDQVIAARAITASKLTGVALDFTQFKPRAGYAGDPVREAYFRTFRYAGALAFLLVPSPATGVTEAGAATMAAAAVALSGLTQSEPVRSAARPLFMALEASFGPADDFGPLDAPADQDAAAVRKQWIETAAALGRVPQVIDVIYESRRLQGRTPGEVAVSWRLLPGRRLGDVAAMQKLVYPATGIWSGTELPPFDAGSINGKLVKAYVGLDDAMALTADVNRAPAFDGLGEVQMQARRAMLETQDASSPVMRLLRSGQATGNQTLMRADALAAAYIHHRHATALVAKQSYSAADKGIRLAPARQGALLASTPHFMRALAAFAEGLAQYYPDPAWDQWSVLLGRMEDIAWMQQRWSGGSAQADKLLNDLDLQVAELVDPAHDRSIVTDIHTCPAESKVVEIGLARPLSVKGGDALGAVLPACQFKQPMDARLTDEAWGQQLGNQRKAYEEAMQVAPAPQGLAQVADPYPKELWIPRKSEAR